MTTRVLPATIAAALCLALWASAPTVAAPAAHAAGACAIPGHGRHLGPTYLLSLSAGGTSCSRAVRVVRDYHACQLRHGGVRGTCRSSVDGFRCSEKRGPSIPTEFFSTVSCRAGSARVTYRYSQFS